MAIGPKDQSTQMESSADAKRKRMDELNLEVNRLTGQVLELEKELRQTRAEERRARAALYRAGQGA